LNIRKTLLSVILLVVGSVGCSQQTGNPAQQKQRITVLTWNIYHGESHYQPGTSNLEAIARIINEYQPDLVALQEVDNQTQRTADFNQGVRKDLVQELAALTGMHGYFGKAMDYDGGGYGEGILSRQPANPIIHPLPIPQGGEPRVLLSIQHILPDGRSITFAGTHLCHEFEANQMAQIKAITRFMDKTGGPVVLAGDFNFTPEHAPYAIINNTMHDAALIYGTTEATWPYHAPAERLDYIFVDKTSQWQVKDIKLIDTDASDHFPVLAVLELL